MPEKFNIASIQTAITQQGATWTAGSTSVTDLKEEDRLILLGANPPDHTASFEERVEHAALAAAAAPPGARSAPSQADLTAYAQPIRNQARCGSCVSFGTIAAVEATARVQAKDPNLAIDLSEAHLFYCHAAAEGRTCENGWWPDNALNAFRDKGVVDEACFPYTPGNQPCKACQDADDRLFKVAAWKSLQSTDEMKSWLATQGALAACFVVYDDFYAYTGGVYRHTTGVRRGGHCVCIVGYSDIDRAWIAKNSWGPGWGERGWFKIAYGDCGIDYEMWAVEIPRTDGQTWLKRQRVTGTWVTNEPRRAAAYLAGAAWKTLAATTDSEFLAMVQLLESARATKTAVDVRLVNDSIAEIYVF